jgi:nudix-type nucleoside diphosphatase (YffH/AdpP family)
MVVKLYEGEVKVLSEEILAETKTVALINRSVQYQRFDGTMCNVQKWNAIKRLGGSTVLIYNKETDKLLLVEQVRPAILTPSMLGMDVERPDNCRTLELLAGGFGKDDPYQCARREAMEEAGIKLYYMEIVAEFYLSPGISNERIHLFYAPITNENIVGKGGGLPEENEDIRCHWVEPEEAEGMALFGQIMDAKTIVGILWFMNKKRK